MNFITRKNRIEEPTNGINLKAGCSKIGLLEFWLNQRL